MRQLGKDTADMKRSRRKFLQTVGATGVAAAFVKAGSATAHPGPKANLRRFHTVQIDVFTSQRLQGNPLSVFTDARGLSDSEMQDLARETNLQETTFVFPRDPVTEREHGVKVRIFVPDEEIPFGGHPTLGTAMVLRNLRLARGKPGVTQMEGVAEVILDLKVGKVPVAFREDAPGSVFGEMRQVEPVFGPLHDRDTVAALLDLKASDIASDWPIQTISTGLPFAIVPLKQLSTLQSLRLDLRKVDGYLDRQEPKCGFYYVTRDTHDPEVGLRARSIYANGEDPATGSAAGCTAAWMVRYGIAQPEQTVHIQQGVEMKRPSQIFVRAGRDGEKIRDVRVGGHAVEIIESEVSL
jgi:trans-2,3-dihydro-3-hydroxyanthranilate isomerase